MWLVSLNSAPWVRYRGWYWYQSFIDVCNISGVDKTDPWNLEIGYLGCWWGRPLGFRIGPCAICPRLFGSSDVEWYITCFDYLIWALWLRFYGWHWYQSFIDGSNIWGVERTDTWSPEIDHSPLGCSYLEEMSRRLICHVLYFLNCILWVRFHGWYWYQSFIDGSTIGSVYRTAHGV